MRHAVYLINRLCKARLGMKSSLHVLNQKYDLFVLRVFACRAYAFIDASLRSKLADRATPLIYVGHEERSTAYLLYSQDKEKVVRSGMVRFDERVDQYGQLVMSWDPSMLTPLRSLYDCESLDGNFVSAFVGTATIILDLRAYVVLKGDEFTGVVKLNSAGGGSFWTPVSAFLEARVEHLALLFEYCAQCTVNSFYPLFEKVTVQRSGGAEWEAAVVCATAREDHVLPYQVILERHAGVRGSAIDVGEARVRFETRHVALAAQEEKVTGLQVGVTEPKGWVQLVNGPDSVQWQESDHKEECALIDVKKAILPVETVPAGEKVMRMVVVYKAKLDSAGELTERKTRWVVCGNGQQHGVHYEDVYAPCTQLSTLRILIQLSLVLGLSAFALDIITCFLNGELDVDVPLYVSWPNARTVRGVRIRVSNIDPCLFYIWQPGTLVVFVYVHVDDYTVFTSSVEWKVEFFRAFSAKWPSKDKGPLVELLGMSMTFSDYGLVRECQISQVGLIQRMLERYSMQDCNPCMTPMESRLSLMPVDSEEKLEKLPYEGICEEQAVDKRQRMAKLLRCESSKTEPGKACSLEEYVARSPEEQSDIYYVVCASRDQALQSPYLEAFDAAGIEVLFFYSGVDEFVMTHLRDFSGRSIECVEAPGKAGRRPVIGELQPPTCDERAAADLPRRWARACRRPEQASWPPSCDGARLADLRLGRGWPPTMIGEAGARPVIGRGQGRRPPAGLERGGRPTCD
ncbi:hypothetical protein CYMTET_51696 [Cymbomonas tetramitiformis]|uniref:Reverse transcriptase Ty1/copia-type domain-containing protein n=1 Tax=Cymbomonas tetramitiformis TaxID=36881 RepID=A0AAE0ERU8_9CHLO|nr:hypothetical protein CYMTET_51696 [Cymbomonas tetramitiformis]